MNPRNERLFVYGTLRQGQALHRHLARMKAPYLGRGWIRGELYDLGEYPGAVRSALSSRRVEGEIYELPKPHQQLPILDEVEEFDSIRPGRSLFVRRRVSVRVETGRPIKAWAYFLQKRPSNGRRIRSGVYTRIARTQSKQTASQ